MPTEIATKYEPALIEEQVYERWLRERAFSATPDDRAETYVIMMPLPNVTGALHMGHAMDNVMQDLLIRWHRMRGDNTLWMPGTDHAGIATQAVVEKRLKELEGKTRHDIGREALVQRIWEWKDVCQKRIIKQQQAMGNSCDWERQRFTLDPICARAVRWTFYRMFDDGLIFRGNRLVNWDCFLKTAVSDDEIEHKTVDGHFWHLKYPVVDPEPGEPDHVIVATTRPETMLGDTAVAVHPDPAAQLDKLIAKTKEKLAAAPAKEKADIEAELERLEKRKASHLPQLQKLAAMAASGRKVMLPLQERAIPIVTDRWAKPELGSGCVKITPAHDPNDYDVWTRHQDEFDPINILNDDGTLNENAGAYVGMDRFKARKKVAADLEAKGLLDAVEERKVEIGHSDRSKTPIEPYLSKQWFVWMADVDGGIVCGRGTPNEHRAPGLAQAAIDAIARRGDWKSPTGLEVDFHPDATRYGNTYSSWLAEKRDWCISRQLWWGHRIPIWHGPVDKDARAAVAAAVDGIIDREDVSAWVNLPDDERRRYEKGKLDAIAGDFDEVEVLVCLRDEDTQNELEASLAGVGLAQDPDVLDTWFSSAVWPHSTLGWPDPDSAKLEEGQSPLAASDGQKSALDYYYPGSCLVTGRDIITLWVARMVLAGLYNLGDVPFTDVFLHASIQDGKGQRMSKSKGNGIDPVDIIDRYGCDAMRYVLCEMQTGMQDIRLPVQVDSPFTGEVIDLAKAKHGKSVFTYICPKSKNEFDVLGTMEGMPSAKPYSERFEVGRNFCNKLWNAVRFALLNLEGVKFTPRTHEELAEEDRWILSRLAAACAEVERQLELYTPSAAIGAAREFFWNELCDWYLEVIKPRMRDEAAAPLAQQVLAFCLDRVLRLLHPFIPFITEELWAKLDEVAPERGLTKKLPSEPMLATAAWPETDPAWRDESLEASFGEVQELIRAIRDIRSKYSVPPKDRLAVTMNASGDAAAAIEASTGMIENLAGLSSVTVAADAVRSSDAATAVVGEVEIFVAGVVDVEQEKKRLTKQRDQLAGRIGGAEKKLGNPGFLKNAKPDVVEREKARLEEMKRELGTLEGNLAALDG